MKLTFVGAAHEVTGSCTLLELGGAFYLIDRGMEQGKDIFENIPLPVPASSLEAVFLTHAHIDHSGLLPKLFRDGFKGKIYSTEVTADLCEIMLRDAAHIHESEAQWKTKKALRNGEEGVEPLYDLNDAEGTLRLFIRCKYGRQYDISESLTIRFTDIGHLLGSACIEMWMNEDGVSKKIVFSGDVGNINQPLIKDPQTVSESDYLVIESTYGNRNHEKAGDTVGELAEYIDRAFARGGSLIIPSFAVGRTQEMLYAIREIKQRGILDKYGNFPVYVDSPMAVQATQIFLQCDPSCFDEETAALLRQGINPIWFEGLALSVTSEDSKEINFDQRPKVIISASGMCEAGRIRHHLKHNLWKAENIVLFVGYQATGSLGRRILDGATTVKLFDEDIAVKAEICTLHGTSGHADLNGLLNWFDAFEKKPHTVFVNHGDEESCENFAMLLAEKWGCKTFTPFSGTQYDLASEQMLMEAEGVRVVAKKKSGNPRASRMYEGLLQAATELYEIARNSRGMANKDISKFTSQLRELIRRWK